MATGTAVAMYAAAAAAAAGAAKSYVDSRAAANKAEAAARENAEIIRKMHEEQIRKKELEKQQALSLSRTKAGASGALLSSGSTSGYLQEMKSTFDADIDWLRQSGQMKQGQETRRGANVASSLRNQGTSALIGGAGRVASIWAA